MHSPQVLTQLIELVSNVTNAFTAALFVSDPFTRTLSLKTYHSLSPDIIVGAQIQFGEGPIGKVAETEKPVLEEKFSGHSSELKIYKTDQDLKGLMALPVKNDRFLGVLAIDTKEAYSFSLRLQKIVADFAKLMAGRLTDEETLSIEGHQEALPYRDLIHYTQSIADSLHPAAMAEQLANIPRSVLQNDAIAVVWMDDEQQTGRIVYFHGWNEDLLHCEIALGKGLAGSTFKNRMPIMIQDFDKHRSILFHEKEDFPGFKAVLSVPIIFKNQLLAVVVCATLQKGEFTNLQLDRLNMLSAFVAPALYYAKEKRQWDYDKNLDQVTGIPNHRCLVAYRNNIEKEVMRGQRLIFFLSINLKNLLQLYEKHGVVFGDQLLKQVVSMLSKVIPSPKFLFKYSDSSFLIIIMKIKHGEIESLETKLRHIFDKTPFFVEGKPLMVEAEQGLSTYPSDGDNLCELASLSWARASQNFKVTHDQKMVE